MNAFASEFEVLRERGFVMPEGQVILDNNNILASDAIAMDAQPGLSTTANAGIPAFMNTYVDPKLINVAFTPMRGGEINGEVKKGDWVTATAIFPMIESTGQVSSYGDWNNNGTVNLNPDFPDRQSYHYQVFANWGEREIEMAGKARIQWVAGLRAAAALKLNKFQNQSYFYGISGLRNYGYLNDPRLPAAIAPATKYNGGTTALGTTWNQASPEEVTDDVISLINQLREQSGGIVDTDSEITIGLSPTRAGIMTKPNQYGLSAWDQLHKQYPSLRYVQAVEFGDVAGMTVQTIIAVAKEVDGQTVAEASFTEKLRTHSVVVESSAWKQKMSQGTWGAVIYLPFGVATMTGV